MPDNYPDDIRQYDDHPSSPFYNKPDTGHLCTQCMEDEVHAPDEWMIDCGNDERLCEGCIENDITMNTMIPWDKLCEFFKEKYKVAE